MPARLSHLLAAASIIAGCSTATTAPLEPGVYRVDVDAGFIANPAHFDQLLVLEADKVCPRGFTRLSEKPDPGIGDYGGRSYVIRCVK